MDSLASSHTLDSRPFRLSLLVNVFVPVLCSFSILLSGCSAVADTSSSRIFEDVPDPGTMLDNRPAAESLARLRIRGLQSEAKGLRQQIASSPSSAQESILLQAARVKSSDPALGLPDVSASGLSPDGPPSGMSPSTTDGQDATPSLENAFRRQSLLPADGKISPRPLGPPSGAWFVTEGSHDGEDAFLRGVLVIDTSYPLVRSPLIVDKLELIGTVLKKALLATYKYFPSTPSKVDQVATTNNMLSSKSDSSDHEGQLQRADMEIVNLLAAENPPPGHESPASVHQTDDSNSSQQVDDSDDFQFQHRSLLQADISPPGMWPDHDDDDDQSQLQDSSFLRGRRLLNLGAISRLGMGQVSNDAENLRRRVLLADISPPGMWPDTDDGVDQLLEFPLN